MARPAAPPRRRKRREESEEGHEGGSERWLVTYADMLTLLFVLFVILFSMSHVDELKYQELREGLAAGFGQAQSLLTGGQSIMQGTAGASNGTASMNQAVGTSPTTPTFNQDTPKEKSQVQSQVAKLMRDQTQRQTAEAQAQVTDLLKLWQRVHRVLVKQGLEHDVQANIDQRGLVISMVSRHIIFPYDSAALTSRGQRIVDVIGSVIGTIPQHLEIDGSTNQQKVVPKGFGDDWTLAYARAHTVLSRLQHHTGIVPGRLEAMSFGHTKPLINPKSPEAPIINKRVDIVVLSNAPMADRAWYPTVASELPPGEAKLLTKTPAATGGNQ